MARRSSRERRRRQANRAMRRLERGYLRDLRKWQKVTGEQLRQCRDRISISIVLQDRQPSLVNLIKTWVKRAVYLFGPMVIDHLQEKRSGVRWETNAVAAIERKDAFDIFEERVLAWLDDYAFSQASDITSSIAELASEILQNAFTEGLGEEETATILQEAIGGDYSSAARIARTEMHTAANIGSDEAARATGLTIVKEWATTEDGRARQSHVDADGQRRPMDEPFDVDGEALDFPGDPKGSAGNIINCRCVALYHPVINGEVFD